MSSSRPYVMARVTIQHSRSATASPMSPALDARFILQLIAVVIRRCDMITIVITFPTTPNPQKTGMITNVMMNLSRSTTERSDEKLVLATAADELSWLSSSEKMLCSNEHVAALLLSAIVGQLSFTDL